MELIFSELANVLAYNSINYHKYRVEVDDIDKRTSLVINNHQQFLPHPNLRISIIS